MNECVDIVVAQQVAQQLCVDRVSRVINFQHDTELALSKLIVVQSLFADYDAVFIGVQIAAWVKHHATKMQRDRLKESASEDKADKEKIKSLLNAQASMVSDMQSLQKEGLCSLNLHVCDYTGRG